MDRRYRRTERLLITAMLDLIEEKAFADITVQDIVDRADVARRTFYSHYENKYQLLWHSLEDHFDAIEQSLNNLDPDTLLADNKPLSYPIFKHVAENSAFYKSMLEQGDGHFALQFMDYIAKKSYEKHATLRAVAPMMSVPPSFIADLLAGALVGVLRWWLRSDLQDTPEQMAYRFSQIVAPGVLQSMGLA